MLDIFHNKSTYVFIGALLVALASWIAALPEPITWANLLEVKNFGTFLGAIGSVLFAWFGKSPLPNGVSKP